MVDCDREDLLLNRIRWTELTPPEWRDRDRQLIRELKLTGSLQPFEKEYFRKDGSRVPVLIGVASFEQGGTQGVAFVLDLTERKRAEKALRESEYKARQIVEAVPGLLWVTDADGEPTHINRQGLDYTGARLEDLTRRGWKEFMHSDDFPESSNRFFHAIQAGTSYQAVQRLRRADGEYRWHHARAEPLRDREGRIIEWYGLSVDIDEGKKAEEALRESEAKFRDYAETASDWFWEIGLDYKFTLLTENAFGSRPADRIGTACWDRALDLETEPEKWRAIRATLDARQPFRDFVYCSIGGNGAPMHVRVSGKPMFDANGEFRGYRGTGTDVTILVRAQEEHEKLRRLESDLAHMNRLTMMGELTASLAHEITQPIATARNNARAAQHFLDKSPPDLGEIQEALACIVDDVDRAGDIVDRIRDHIKKAPPRKERFDMNKAIDEVIGLAGSAITTNGVAVRTGLAEALLPVEGDRVQLQQVVLNLILNAVEAMSTVEAGPRELSINTEPNRTDGVLVSVRDSGPGIDPDHLDRIFEAFYTTKSSGTGMGLSICRSIIDAHGGRLWADVNEPRGAVFRFTLPGADKVLTGA
jgi:PAS domain S-box-containing protein